MTDQALVTGVLAEALDEHRDRCNALIAAAGRAHADFDPDVVVAQLRGPIGELVEACDRITSGAGSRVLAAVFPIVTDLAAQHRLGAGRGHDALLGRLPALARQVAAEPRLVVGSLANAVVHLEHADVPVDPWLDRIVAVTDADVPTLLAVGQVAAWALGLAPARASAIDVAARLDDRALAAAFAVPGSLDVGDTVQRLRADRWWRPDAAAARQVPDLGGTPPRVARVVARVGGFRGFGGPFLAPPVVAARGGDIVVRSGPDAWALHADAFGAALSRVADDGSLPPPARVDAAAIPPGIVPLGIAATADLVAITIASSYQVLVVEPAR